jgi:beta-galactosidase
VIFATQYFRPPFPDRVRWADDLAAIKTTGFDAIYVTAPWSWIEPAPGEFDYDDFDQLFERAGRVGLKVIVNLWSEIQPLWIHREIPGSEMVNHLGHKVVSSQLAYMHFGLSPGGCTDNPEIERRGERFLRTTVARYAAADALLLWDCWNEIRWLTQADGYVCYCEHTTAAFRDWLRESFGSLDALNEVWRRRYRSWEDVLPAKLPTRTYTDVIAFQAFLTWRATRDLRRRADAVRAEDSAHPVIAHAAFPAIHNTGEFFEWEQALARGNDWDLADQVDGWGASHFPAWIHPAPSDYGLRLEASRCAAGDKPYWIAELQGGAAGHGHQAMQAVDARRQARWVWSGVARGAKGINFWCWRDEVFGRESGGFGIVGADGGRDDRLEQLTRTASLFERHADLLDGYRPAQSAVGVVFEPSTYHLDWAGQVAAGLGAAGSRNQAGHSVQGYLRALERLQIPYDVVEPAHARLERYRLLVLPWALIVRPQFAEQLVSWVQAGGTLLVEAETDAFDANGLYRYPDERPMLKALRLEASGRTPIDNRTIAFDLAGESGSLRPATWVQALGGSDDAVSLHGLGRGTVVAVPSHPGLAYFDERHESFERFVHALARSAGALPGISCSTGDGEVVQWRFGRSGDAWLLFVTNEGDATHATFDFASGTLAGCRAARDLVTERVYAAEDGTLDVALDEGGHHVLVLEDSP